MLGTELLIIRHCCSRQSDTYRFKFSTDQCVREGTTSTRECLVQYITTVAHLSVASLLLALNTTKLCIGWSHSSVLTTPPHYVLRLMFLGQIPVRAGKFSTDTTYC